MSKKYFKEEQVSGDYGDKEPALRKMLILDDVVQITERMSFTMRC
jgi:hypothetical protein